MSNTIETNLLRAFALKQHLGEDFFLLTLGDGTIKAYEGTEEDAREQFMADIEGTEEAEIDANFEIFCSNNLAQVEPIEGDDYNSDYLVLTDEEADEKWEESLDSYIEECIQPEMDRITDGQSNLSYYIKFDEEMWKRDARIDGRGHSLATYDGCENEETVEGITFYIYRIN